MKSTALGGTRLKYFEIKLPTLISAGATTVVLLGVDYKGYPQFLRHILVNKSSSVALEVCNRHSRK
jgi:hypothetical protein